VGALENAVNFGRRVLGMNDLYPWQEAVLMAISEVGTRRRIAVKAPNGAGKDDRIIAPSALWWIRRFPKGRVIITSKDSHQLRDQTWAAMVRHWEHFGDCKRG
jgi:hypothetical protein